MGLDQYAGLLVQESDGTSDIESYKFTWRKHARLQQFFVNEYKKQHKTKSGDEISETKEKLGFNSGDGGVKITRRLIKRLAKEVAKGYPNSVAKDGFFWGQQWQEESVITYKKQDEDFVKWCRKELKAGKQILYDCWW